MIFNTLDTTSLLSYSHSFKFGCFESHLVSFGQNISIYGVSVAFFLCQYVYAVSMSTQMCEIISFANLVINTRLVNSAIECIFVFSFNCV